MLTQIQQENILKHNQNEKKRKENVLNSIPQTSSFSNLILIIPLSQSIHNQI